MRRIRPARRHRQPDSESGNAAVEFALVIPLLLLILCGIFDFGNLYFQMDVVNEAARQGARLFAVNVSTSTSPCTLTQITTNLQSGYGNQLTVKANPSAPASGSSVTVTVTENVTIMTPVISAFFTSNPTPVSGACTMYVE